MLQYVFRSLQLLSLLEQSVVWLVRLADRFGLVDLTGLTVCWSSRSLFQKGCIELLERAVLDS